MLPLSMIPFSSQQQREDPQETETCICCGAESACRKRRDLESRKEDLPAGIAENMDIEVVECHVCGYSWQESLDRGAPVDVVGIAHDISNTLPGQPTNRTTDRPIPTYLSAKKPSRDMKTDRVVRITDWSEYQIISALDGDSEAMTREEFNDELSRRWHTRKAVACN